MPHTAPTPHKPAGRAPVLAVIEHAGLCVLSGVMIAALVKAIAPTSPDSTAVIAFTVSILVTSVVLRAALRWWYGPGPISGRDPR
ncbi:MAG: hypothetical protein Q4C85_05110 [Actinomyces sp.]|uniref:hypothetical protein n=1 Tax=Actinomyces sp. TaxID=29317 RepID=UPI0026DBDEE1|nr:hypothetical protein [Actinomyces sp.]MDO4243130.1 hypothetical protein [Actinomyces sp.]